MASRAQYKRIAAQAADRYGINRRLFLRQMRQESGFQPGLTSSAGAQGPAQIMPATARAWGVKNPNDPHEAYNAAAKHMAGYLKSYGGSWRKALIAYNAGPGRVGDSSLPSETIHYIDTILGGRSEHVERPGRGPGRPAQAGGRLPAPGSYRAGRAPRVIPGGETVDKRAALVAALMDKRKNMGLLDRYRDAVSTGEYTTVTETAVVPGKGAKYRLGKGGVKVAGRPAVPGGGKGGDPGTIHELFWNGPGATNIDNGKKVGKGFVSGHTDHVHLAADPATMRRAAALAKRLGLHVGEYGKGIRSGHATNSFHYKPYGAMDVSGDTGKMAEFARRVARGQY